MDPTTWPFAMIDICAFFEYTTDVSRGKMVTIHRKNLLASCLFLLGYSSFFLLAVSGSYDYTASGTLASELEPSRLGKHRNEWLSNHEWDYSSLKGNYHSRRKSRSTLENETLRAEGAGTEETSQGAGGKWVPRRKRKFERFVGLESIGNASGSVQEEKEKEDTDAIKNTTVTVEPIENSNNLKNDTKQEVSDDGKTDKKDHLKDEVSAREGKEKNATEILEFRSKLPRFPTKLGREGLDGEPKDGGYPTQRWRTSVGIPPKQFLKEILRRKDHRHRKGGKKGGVPDIELENSNDYDEDSKEEKEDEEGKDEDVEEEKEEADFKESRENGDGPPKNVSSSAMELIKIISNVFLPMRNNDTGIGPYPWRALTSSRYTKEVTKQEGPHLKRTTKETKSKVNLFFANNLGQMAEGKDNPTNPQQINNSEIVRTDRSLEKDLSERSKSMETTTSEPIKLTTTEASILSKSEKKCEPAKENVERSWISNEKDESHDTIVNIFDTTVLLVTRILDLRDQPNLDWY